MKLTTLKALLIGLPLTLTLVGPAAFAGEPMTAPTLPLKEFKIANLINPDFSMPENAEDKITITSRKYDMDNVIQSKKFSSYQEAEESLKSFAGDAEAQLAQAENARIGQTLYQHTQGGYKVCYAFKNIKTQERISCGGLHYVDTTTLAGYIPKSLKLSTPTIVAAVNLNDSSRTTFTWSLSLKYKVQTQTKSAPYAFGDEGVVDGREWTFDK